MSEDIGYKYDWTIIAFVLMLANIGIAWVSSIKIIYGAILIPIMIGLVFLHFLITKAGKGNSGVIAILMTILMFMPIIIIVSNPEIFGFTLL